MTATNTIIPEAKNRKDQHQHIVIYMLILATLVGTYSFYLVLARQPLPIDSLLYSSLIAVGWSFICIFALLLLRLPFISFPFLFLIGTWLFTFSIFILYFFEGVAALQDNFLIVSRLHIAQGLPITMLAFSSFFIGCFWGNKRNKNNNVQQIRYTSLSPIIWKVALTVFMISFAIILFYSFTGSGLSIAYTSAYSGNQQGFSDLRKMGDLPTIFLTALYWFAPWSALILLATAYLAKQKQISFFVGVVTIAFASLAGDRNIPLSLLFLGFCVYYLQQCGKISWKYLLLSLLVALFLVQVVPEIRKTPIQDWSLTTFIEALNPINDFDNNLIASILSSFASSYQTLMGTLMFVPDIEAYRYGADYLIAFSNAIPYSNRFLPLDITTKPTTWITQLLSPNGWSGLGYLQMAEAYLQFGAIGVLVLYLILGWFLVRLWRKLENGVSAQFLAFSILIVHAIFIWIRNDSGGIPRALLWAWILVYLLPSFLSGTSLINVVAVRSYAWNPNYHFVGKSRVQKK